MKIRCNYIFLFFPADTLQDFEIYIGSASADGNFPSNGYKLCKKFPGSVTSGDAIKINCTSVTTGRFVAIQMLGTNKVLTLCEVDVFPSRTGNDIFWN